MASEKDLPVHANPFDSPAISAPASRPASRQPYAFGAMGALVFALGLLISNLIAAASQPDLLVSLLDYLPSLLPGWLFAALLNALACLLLARGYMEHHAIVFSHPGRLLVATGGAIVLVDLLYGALSGFLLSGLYQWLGEQGEMLALYQTLVFEPLGLLAFAITVLLPLGIALRLGARHTDSQENLLPRQEAPLLLALCFVLLNLKTLDLLPGHLLNDYEWHLELVLLYLSPLLCGALIFSAAWQDLPTRQSRLHPGRLALAGLLIFAGWLAAQLTIAGLLLLAALAGSEALFHPAVLLLGGIGLLLLLWPLTCLSLRWVYRPQAA